MFSVILETDEKNKQASTQIELEKVGIQKEGTLSAGMAPAFSQPHQQWNVTVIPVLADHTLRKLRKEGG